MPASPEDIAEFAARIWRVVDRVHIGVHRTARRTAIDTMRSLVDRTPTADGEPLNVGFLIDLRFAIPARPLTRDGLAAVYRYRDPAEVAETIDTHVAQGALREDPPGTLHATDATRELLSAVYDLHAQVTDELWRVAPWTTATLVDDLAELVGTVLAEAAATGGPAFAQTAPPYEPSGTPAGLLLFNRLAALRYHRADAHAAAWRAAGLSAADIRALPGDDPRRVAIEAETDRLAAPPYTALRADDRLRLLAGLGALPG